MFVFLVRLSTILRDSHLRSQRNRRNVPIQETPSLSLTLPVKSPLLTIRCPVRWYLSFPVSLDRSSRGPPCLSPTVDNGREILKRFLTGPRVLLFFSEQKREVMGAHGETGILRLKPVSASTVSSRLTVDLGPSRDGQDSFRTLTQKCYEKVLSVPSILKGVVLSPWSLHTWRTDRWVHNRFH